MFAVLGTLLAGFGAFSNRQIYVRSLNLNVNLMWGLVLLGFGAVMLLLGWNTSRKAKVSEPLTGKAKVGN
jgi:hypothetical protein